MEGEAPSPKSPTRRSQELEQDKEQDPVKFDHEKEEELASLPQLSRRHCDQRN
jgi:hypothetical protein